ncbi:MAG: glycosyltransferase 87 family protein [Candidatus Limnocylindrales bacterium]
MALVGRRVPVTYILAVIAAVATWLFIVAWCEPYGRWPGTAMDAHAYWSAPGGPDPYAIASVGHPNAYLYSPVFLQLLWPMRLLSWQGFVAVWALFPLAALAYLTGPRLFLLGLALTFTEVAGGNIELLIGVAIVLGFRWPAAWCVVLLTKVTPGLGLLWFVVRREWRSLIVALAATAAVVAVSYAIQPEAWVRWLQVLTSNTGATNGTWAAIPIPFIVRCPFAVVVVVWGARTNRRWTVPISAMLALPALWYGGLSIIIATLPLLGARTWGELRQVLGRGWAELAGELRAAHRAIGRRFLEAE